MAWKRRLHRMRYFCADAWSEWRHSLGVNLLALLTLVSALFVAGLVLLIVTNVEQRVQSLRDQVKIEVYLRDDAADEARVALTERLAARPRVERVVYVDKDEALRRYREWAADLARLVHELEGNPLPASLEVVLEPGAGATEVAGAIAAELEGHAAVEEVRFNQVWLDRLADLLALSRIGGGAVIVLVFVAVVLVMGSVLRLAVHARRDEIEIMQLVGATPGFIRGPYLVAGAVQGLIASVLALLLVEGVRGAASASVGPGGAVLLDLIAARPLSGEMAAWLLLLGLLVSLTGSYVSVRRST
jgi:cell division transport system permease protein